MGVSLSLAFIAAAGLGFADAKNPYQANIERGRAFLFEKMKDEKRIGYLGLGVMALLKTAPIETSGPLKGRFKKTPELQRLMDRFAREAAMEAREFRDQEGTYALAVAVSCLIADDAGKHERLIRELVARIIVNQKPNGSWTYPSGAPETGDTSQVQYIALALWEAASVGFDVPQRVWDSALDWQIRTQDAQGAGGPGGFVYHPQRIPTGDGLVDQGNETATMGVAGLSTLLICKSRLPYLARVFGKGVMLIDELIRPAADDGDAMPFTPKVTAESALAAIARAEAWVARNSIFRDPFKDLNRVNYYLYGYERVAALRKGAVSPVTAVDWYRVGGDYLARTQKPDGSWSNGANWSAEADTAFAILFLGRVTANRDGILKVEVLRRSRAVGGEGGLPNADGAQGGNAFRRQHDRFRAPVRIDIEGLVRILEDPDAVVPEEDAIAAEQLTPEQLAELVQKAGGDDRRLCQWAYDQRPAARRAALAIIAKSRDLRTVPIFLDALRAKDAEVYAAAREGLRYLSRNVEVFGLPQPDMRTPEALEQGVKRAEQWFRSLKVEVAASQEFAPAGPAANR
jgi:hypothetical protein